MKNKVSATRRLRWSEGLQGFPEEGEGEKRKFGVSRAINKLSPSHDEGIGGKKQNWLLFWPKEPQYCYGAKLERAEVTD